MCTSPSSLDTGIHDAEVVSLYRRFVFQISTFKGKDRFYSHVFNSISAIANKLPKKNKNSLSLHDVAIKSSEFPHIDSLLGMPDFDINQVYTLSHSFVCLRHPTTSPTVKLYQTRSSQRIKKPQVFDRNLVRCLSTCTGQHMNT